jgi:hypothetical protein
MRVKYWAEGLRPYTHPHLLPHCTEDWFMVSIHFSEQVIATGTTDWHNLERAIAFARRYGTTLSLAPT